MPDTRHIKEMQKAEREAIALNKLANILGATCRITESVILLRHPSKMFKHNGRNTIQQEYGKQHRYGRFGALRRVYNAASKGWL